MTNESTNKPITRAKMMEAKLNSLLEITRAINHNYSTTELLEIFENVLSHQLNIGKLVLFSNSGGGWRCLLKYGMGDAVIKIDVVKELYHIKEITLMDFAPKATNHSFDIVVPVYHKDKPLAYVLIGDLNEEKIEMSPTIRHMPFIQTLTNIIVVAIENKQLAKETIRQAAMKKELELAWEMQSMLFPSSLPNNNLLEIDAIYMPHQQVGGDYYDFIQLNENEVAFCMADVSGKGVAAALLMSNFQANLRVLFNHTTSLTDLVNELNSKVMASAKGEKFITLFIAKYNMVTKILSYVNAGQNPPLLLSDKSVSFLRVGCTGLGMFDELIKVKEGIVNLENGATIICYTDGVVEVENENEEDFGVERLRDLLTENSNMKMKDLNLLIKKTLIEHKGVKPYIDDIALFSCRIR